jgi:DNA processing protein
MSVDVEGCAAALVRLPDIGPSRLRMLLAHHSPSEALAAFAGRAALHPMVLRKLPTAVVSAAMAAARHADPAGELEACRAADVSVVVSGQPGYPVALAADPRSPAVLFVRGDTSALEARRVGVIGTRNATASGLATARELGCGLAEAGVAVVSGLARGIDGAAHSGVRSAGPDGAQSSGMHSDGTRGLPAGRPIAVVGSGPDVVYPRRHAELWHWVATTGVLLSEWPPGTTPDAWRFPQRNRIIAGLSEVVVVVESRERGGSLITARQAADRGVEVMAVPGSTRCAASAGTNRLLRDGAGPVTSVDDVLMMLGLDHRRQGTLPFDPRPLPTGDQALVLAACEAEPRTLDSIASSTGMPLVDAALAAARLERSGWLVEAGGWFEPAGSRFDMARRAAS